MAIGKSNNGARSTTAKHYPVNAPVRSCCPRKSSVNWALQAVLLAAWLARSVLPAPAEETNLVVTADTFIGSGALEANNGGANQFLTAGVDLQGNRHRALYKFDVSAIPSNAIITSAVFSTTTRPASRGPFPAVFALHAVLADWTEGSGSGLGMGGPALAGEVSWTSRKLGAAVWTNAGGDFTEAPLATAEVDSFGQIYTWGGEGVLGAVQSWVANPALNHGFLLKAQTEDGASIFQLGSREGGQPATLAIGYSVPTPPPRIQSVTLAPSGRPRLVWSGNPGKQYTVEFASALATPVTWSVAESNIIAALSGVNEWQEPIILPPASLSRFYRVREDP